jgi:serine O-acetyltransferase
MSPTSVPFKALLISKEQADISSFTEQLDAARQAHSLLYDFRSWTPEFVAKALGLLFPHFADPKRSTSAAEDLASLRDLLCDAVRGLSGVFESSESVAEAFLGELPNVYRRLLLDGQAVVDFDPAAKNLDEVIFAYPGFYALAVHRLAHELYKLRLPFLPRLLGEFAHSGTGIDIHPGASIGEPFFMDHGTGIVIGETAVIGKRVKIYQGATLGAYQVRKTLAGVKRHPTIEDDVVIYSNATILGGATVIGARSVIGANSWVTESIPPDSVVSHRTTVQLPKEDRSYDLIEFNI